MDELVQQIVSRTGITEAQAIEAVHAMKDYIMGKVPPMFSGFVENFFVGGTSLKEEDPLS